VQAHSAARASPELEPRPPLAKHQAAPERESAPAQQQQPKVARGRKRASSQKQAKAPTAEVLRIVAPFSSRASAHKALQRIQRQDLDNHAIDAELAPSSSKRSAADSEDEEDAPRPAAKRRSVIQASEDSDSEQELTDLDGDPERRSASAAASEAVHDEDSRGLVYQRDGRRARQNAPPEGAPAAELLAYYWVGPEGSETDHRRAISRRYLARKRGLYVPPKPAWSDPSPGMARAASRSSPSPSPVAQQLRRAPAPSPSPAPGPSKAVPFSREGVSPDDASAAAAASRAGDAAAPVRRIKLKLRPSDQSLHGSPGEAAGTASHASSSASPVFKPLLLGQEQDSALSTSTKALGTKKRKRVSMGDAEQGECPARATGALVIDAAFPDEREEAVRSGAAPSSSSMRSAPVQPLEQERGARVRPLFSSPPR
jgi:hypothetical protein